MIDWLTFVAPLRHAPGIGGPFYAGSVMSTVPDPEQGERLEWESSKRLAMVGSHSQCVQVRSCVDEEGRRAVQVSGNPAKWFQGHNIFGSNDVHGLSVEMLERIAASVGITPSDNDRSVWRAGCFRLSRADVTNSYELASLAQVRNALRSLDASANLRHRGRGLFNGEWLLFGKGSRRWSLTIYAKGLELLRHGLPAGLLESSLSEYAQGLLRVEVRLMSLQLASEQLVYAGAWGDNTASELHSRYVGGLQIMESAMLTAHVLEGLSPRLQLAYNSWAEGHDLRSMLPPRTFYRYRTELLKSGIDIAVKQERTGPDLSNVVPLRTVLHAYPARVPEWAVGTPLYFEPRASACAA